MHLTTPNNTTSTFYLKYENILCFSNMIMWYVLIGRYKPNILHQVLIKINLYYFKTYFLIKFKFIRIPYITSYIYLNHLFY